MTPSSSTEPENVTHDFSELRGMLWQLSVPGMSVDERSQVIEAAEKICLRREAEARAEGFAEGKAKTAEAINVWAVKIAQAVKENGEAFKKTRDAIKENINAVDDLLI